MSADQARMDLVDKLVLERSLKRKLVSMARRIKTDFTKGYANSGEIINAETYRDDYVNILNGHYDKTGEIFSVRISDDLSNGITDDESEKIAEALALYYMVRSAEQAQLITKTNQKDITESLEDGILSASEQEGSFSRIDAALFAGATLGAKLLTRVDIIAVFETQSIAEAAKNTEAEVLSGLEPSIVSTSPIAAKVKKEWVTVGDERVREAHMLADGQQVQVNDAYTVGGQSLRYPGDTSLGASMANVLGCRCASVPDKQSIDNLRGVAGFAPISQFEEVAG